MANQFSALIKFLLCIVATISIAKDQDPHQEKNVKKRFGPRTCVAILIDPNDSVGTALRCAEAFLKDNGYTDNQQKISRLASESIERANSKKQLLNLRFNSIKLPAIGVCRKGILIDDWTVVFESARPGEDSLSGRAVTMNADYSGLRMEHMDFDINFISDPTSGCKDLRKTNDQ